MNGLPYYKRYPRDFLDGTAGMSFELKGAYSVLLDLIYIQSGKCPDDPHYISGHLGCSVRKWNSVKNKLIEAGKIQVANGVISNFRANKEQIISSKYQDKQAENRRRPNKNNDLQAPKPHHTDTDTDTDITIPIGMDGQAVNATSEAIWNRGVPFLCERGVPDKQARSVIGRWVRDNGAQAVFDALAEANRAGTGDPVPYITKILKPKLDVDSVLAGVVEGMRQ